MSFYVRQAPLASPRVRYQLTLVLIIVNIVVFVLTYSLSTYGISEYWIETLAQNNARILVYGEWWRMFTATWLHADLVHLGSNMLGLLMFGVSLESIARRWQYVVIYFAAGLLGGLGSLAFSDPFSYSLGASGCIFGVLAASMIGQRALIKQNLCKSFLYIAMYVGFSAGPGVDNWAHIFGAVAGVLLILVFTRGNLSAGRRVKHPAADSPSRYFAYPSTPVPRITCPYCRQLIPADARDCPYCNRPLPFL